MRNAIVKQSYTAAALNATGYVSNATGATWTLSATTAADSLAHPVTIKNDSANDHSAKTAVLTGTDANDNALTETLALPAGSATVTSTKMFKTLTTVVPSATIGADTMDIGWTAVAQSPWVYLDYGQSVFNVSVAANIGGTINYDVEHTYEAAVDGSSFAFKHTGLTSKTTDQDGQYIAPVSAVRVNINSHTAGTVDFYVVQGGN